MEPEEYAMENTHWESESEWVSECVCVCVSEME